MNYAQLQQLWLTNGGPPAWAPTMAAIGLLESGGDPNAQNPSGATGIWQVEWPLHSDLSPDGSRQALFDPNNNAKAAIAILNGGAGLCSGWGTVQGGDALGIAVCKAGSQPWSTAQIQNNGFGQYTTGGDAGLTSAQSASIASGGQTTPRVGCSGKGGNGDGVLWSFPGFFGAGSFDVTYCMLKGLTGFAVTGVGVFVMGVGVILVVTQSAKGRQAIAKAAAVPGAAQANRAAKRVAGERAASAAAESNRRSEVTAARRRLEARRRLNERAAERNPGRAGPEPVNRRQGERMDRDRFEEAGLSTPGPADRRTGSERLRKVG